MSSSPTAALSRRPLMEVFAQVPDPRDPRGVRHDLATVLTLAQTAVLAGARTLLAIAEWTQDTARETLSRIGIDADRTLPSESTIRRTLAQVDANDLDLLMSGWMATRVGELAGRRIIAVDGKTMRGARTPAGAPHLVAAFDHAAGAVVGQLAVATKSNEIPALRDLLDGMDITDAVLTADAMHCVRDTATHITDRGGHYLLTIKNNQPSLRAACKALPWKHVPAVTVTDRSHGRRVRRTVKAVQAPDWIEFPGVAQIVQLRRTRTIKGGAPAGVRAPRMVLPSTAMIRRPASSPTRVAIHPDIRRSRSLASTWARVRRTVDSEGRVRSASIPMRDNVSRAVSWVHSAIASRVRAPASTAVCASVSTVARSCRTPLGSRGSGTCANTSISGRRDSAAVGEDDMAARDFRDGACVRTRSSRGVPRRPVSNTCHISHTRNTRSAALSTDLAEPLAQSTVRDRDVPERGEVTPLVRLIEWVFV